MEENNEYLTTQLITYLGNKRALLPLISEGLAQTQIRLHKIKMDTFDVFSGSGIVARFLKQYSSRVITNDMEEYSHIIAQCYMTNDSDFDSVAYHKWYSCYNDYLRMSDTLGIISANYAPKDANNIKMGERCFYTPENARVIDATMSFLSYVPEDLKKYFLGPLLSEASVHVNTSGLFKGFYKDSTGLGAWGGNAGNAVQRICGAIEVNPPVLSNFECEHMELCLNAIHAAEVAPEVDVAYLDPPYNQHPYGSNYFMLNIIASGQMSDDCSEISGIPNDWNRSAYNKKAEASLELERLIEAVKAKFILLSYNNEGIIPSESIDKILSRFGDVNMISKAYPTFRGSRNLQNRGKAVEERLYILEKR